MTACESTSECVFVDEKNATIGFGICFEKDGLCSCDTEFGWGGEFCSEPTAQLQINRVLYIIRPILFILLAIYTIVLMRRLSNYTPDLSLGLEMRRTQLKTKRNLLILLGLVLIASLGYLADINTLIALFDPTYFELSDDVRYGGTLGGFFNVKYRNLVDSVRIFPLGCITLSQAMIPSSWVDLVEQLQDFSKAQANIYFLVRYKKAFPYLVFAVLLILCFLLVIEQTLLVFSFLNLLSLMLLVLFFFAKRRLLALLKEFSGDTRGRSTTVALIRKSARVYVAAITFSLIVVSFLFGLVVLSEEPNAFLGGLLLNLVLTFGSGAILLNNVYYVRVILLNLLETKEKIESNLALEDPSVSGKL